VIVVLLLGLLTAVVAAPPPARAAAKQRSCKTVKRHGKKVKVCTRKPAHRPGTTPTPTATSTPTATPTETLPVQPSDGLPAVTIAPHPDASRAVTQTITTDGGTISATGADGTVYTLTLQKDSLELDQAITLTPLSAADGLPGGHALAAGVQLDPQGLQLVKPATLTIKLATPIPVASQLSFASDDSGSDFHLYPQTYDPSTIAMEIDHFTEYGAFAGSPADLVAQLHHGTVSYLALTEQLRAALAEVRAAQLAGGPEPYTPDQLIAMLANTANAWYDQKILPEMQIAAQPDADDNQVTAAIHDALSWDHQVQVLGLINEPGFADKEKALYALIDQAVLNAYERARKRCTDLHDILAISRLLALEHTIELLGITPPNHNVDDDIRKCVSFELDVDTTITRDYHIGTSVEHSHVQVNGLPLTADGGLNFLLANTLTGSKNPEQVSWSKSSASPCSYTFTGAEAKSPFTARLHFTFSKKPDGTLNVPQITMTVSTGEYRENATFLCPNQRPEPYPWDTFQEGWYVLHHSEDASPGGTLVPQTQYLINNWTYLGGEVWATKTYNQTIDQSVGNQTVTWTESTTLTLRHTPLQ
jgi:hypothetical protein